MDIISQAIIALYAQLAVKCVIQKRIAHCAMKTKCIIFNTTIILLALFAKMATDTLLVATTVSHVELTAKYALLKLIVQNVWKTMDSLQLVILWFVNVNFRNQFSFYL